MTKINLLLCDAFNLLKVERQKCFILFKMFLLQNYHVSPAQSVFLALTKGIRDFSVGTEIEHTILIPVRSLCACQSLREARRQQNHEYSHHLTS
jgi:hypothetical protein